MKYKVTTRGWVVFSILGIIVIVLVASMFNNPDPDQMNSNAEMNNQATAENNEAVEVESEGTKEVELDSTSGDETTSESEETSTEAEQNSNVTSSDSEETSKTDSTETSTEEKTEDEVDYDKETIVLFDKNIAVLEDVYFEDLNEWVILLNDNDLTVTVEGHINGYPYYKDGDFGLSLAESRANIIKDYMIGQGVDDKRILIVNMGSNRQTSEKDNFYMNRKAIIYFNEKP